MFGAKRREQERLEELRLREQQRKWEDEQDRLSSRPGCYWSGNRLIDAAESRVVGGIEVSDSRVELVPFYLWPYRVACEWKTSDGERFINRAAAKKHEEKLISR